MSLFSYVRDIFTRRFGSYLDRRCATCDHKLGDHYPVNAQPCAYQWWDSMTTPCPCEGFQPRT